MLIFGHTGFTLATAVLFNGAFAKHYNLPDCGDKLSRNNRPLPEQLCRQSFSSKAELWLTSLGNRIDIRLLLIGSLLPDLVDKPVGRFFFRDIFNNGYIFCHTLLFLIIMTLIGLFIYCSRKKTWLLALSFGTFTHFILDGMWQIPRTLLWPLYGISFGTHELTSLSEWIQMLFQNLLIYPVISILELAGAVIIIWFVYVLVRRKHFYMFLRNGAS